MHHKAITMAIIGAILGLSLGALAFKDGSGIGLAIAGAIVGWLAASARNPCD